MAGPPTCRSPYQNPPPTGEDELAGGAQRAPTNDSGTSTPTSATSRAPTSAPIPIPGSAPGPTNVFFKQFVKAYPEAQTHLLSTQSQAEDHFDTTGPPAQTEPRSPPHSSAEVAASDGPSISVATKVRG